MTAVTTEVVCARCPYPLDTAAVLCGAEWCTDCERKTFRPSTEWGIFTRALHDAAVDGIVHQSEVRPLVRGRIKPHRIGGLYRRARHEGLLVEVGHERSDDHEGKNAGRMEPKYELRGAA